MTVPRILYTLPSLLVLASATAFAQNAAIADPHVTATPVDGGMWLRWQPMGDAMVFSVSRRDAGAASFGTIAVLDAGATAFFVDERLTQRTEFTVSFGNRLTGNAGFVMAATEAPFRDDQGVVLIIIDDEQAKALAPQLTEWEDDLRDDGWAVVREALTGTETPPQVKALVARHFAALGQRLRSVFLFGKVPRAFSGLLAPDGHPDHLGAWPADSYYADLDGVWLDLNVNWTQAPAFSNVPGDGKFDPSLLPSTLEVAIGRVDFEDMPAFGTGPVPLLARYLAKAHAHRLGTSPLPVRTLVDDNFGGNTENFARGAYRDGTAITGQEPEAVDLFDSFRASQGYLMAYACGAGSPIGAGGVGETHDFAETPARALFIGLFGSYFGDWSYTDNFMRAAIAAEGNSLETLWFSRPQSHLHSLAALETFGDAFLRGINGQMGNVYEYGTKTVHQALLGDPTIRLFYSARFSGLTATPQARGAGVKLQWPEPSNRRAVGVHVYRRLAGSLEAEVRLTAIPSGAGEFTDLSAPPNTMVEYRAVLVERVTTGSGTFLNHSLADRVHVVTPDTEPPPPSDAGSEPPVEDAGVGTQADAGLGTQADAGIVTPEVDAGTSTPRPDAGTPHGPEPAENVTGCNCSETSALPYAFALAALVLRRGCYRRTHGHPAKSDVDQW